MSKAHEIQKMTFGGKEKRSEQCEVRNLVKVRDFVGKVPEHCLLSNPQVALVRANQSATLVGRGG